ncbi:MAG TPA: DUF4129 domain-containing protein [Halococcus sp.]|nr:DUF4129 domain-containing protein [Halococcus sp.]
MAPADSGDTHRATVLSCLLLIAIVSASFGGSAVGVTAGSEPGWNTELGVQAAQQNNTTIRHENPESVDKEGNLSKLQTWLSGRLTQSLIDCTEGLKVGQYDVCNSSRNYPEWLNKYVNITRETDSADNRTGSFTRARETQTTYASNIHRFRNTLSAYRTARRNGNTDRARTLARQLQRISARVNETGSQLTGTYRVIDNATSQNVSGAIDTTNTITRNVTETAETIEVEQFINTTIRADTSSTEFSFRRPLQVSGRLVAENGTPLANRTIRLMAGNHSRETTTDATGQFTFTYRPTVLPLDTEHVTVRYVPSVLSPYRDNETTLPVRVVQVEPRLDVVQYSTRMRFNDTVLVSGRVSVNDTGARSVPISVSVGGQPLTPARNQFVRTNSAGKFTFVARLPPDVMTGKQAMRVSLPLNNQALNRTVVTKPVVISSTPTTLVVNGSQTSVNGSEIDGPVVRVAGRLKTGNGTPIQGQSISIRLNGTTVGAARTDESGRYITNVTVPQQLFAERSGAVMVSLVAAYDGKRTNLESSRARKRLRLVVPSEPPESIVERIVRILETVPLVYWFIVGIGLLLLSIYSAYRYNNRSNPDPHGTETTEESAVDRRSDSERTNRPPLLEAASEQLFAGDAEGAIVAAYTGVRARLGNELDLASPYTHWEFFDTCRLRGLRGDRLDALERLTELYEQAAFSQHPPSKDVATTAIEDAQTVSGLDRPPESQNTADN